MSSVSAVGGGSLAYAVAMEAKNNDMIRQQGEAIVAMIDASAVSPASGSSGTRAGATSASVGSQLNVVA